MPIPRLLPTYKLIKDYIILSFRTKAALDSEQTKKIYPGSPNRWQINHQYKLFQNENIRNPISAVNNWYTDLGVGLKNIICGIKIGEL
jgi:hypothetical protein